MFAKAVASLKEWSGVLALFLVLSGGVAYAVDTVGSADVIDNSLLSADLKDQKAVQGIDVRDHSLTGVDIAAESVGGSRITDGTITGADVADQSGVDTCTHGTTRFGELCVMASGQRDGWSGGLYTCRNIGLRLPTLGEALALAASYDVPNLDVRDDYFWTDENLPVGSNLAIWEVDEDGMPLAVDQSQMNDIVCVTTPTN